MLWYAGDTSKKARSAFQAKNLAGKHTASSVSYGYLKSEQDMEIAKEAIRAEDREKGIHYLPNNVIKNAVDK